MRSKRLLTILMVVCMLMSCFTPAAATSAGRNAYKDKFAHGAVAADKNNDASKLANDMLLDQNGKLQTGVQTGIETLRDNTDHVTGNGKGESHEEGQWIIAPSDKDVTGVVPGAKLPESVTELRKLAGTYADNEVVRAFVVMEEEPLAQTYSSVYQVPESIEEMMEQFQKTIIAMIEKSVLGGEKLDVLHQFTYLLNAFSISTEFGHLEEIAYIDGVESVFLMPTYSVCEAEEGLMNVATPLTESAKDMTGVSQVWETLGLTGSGMTIAIIDTGLDLDHPSFAASPAGAQMDAADIAAVLEDLNAYAYADYAGFELTAEDLYRSEKVPFAFNYVDFSLDATHDNDEQGDHGTHVAGIAAANAVEGTGVVGMAPDAQLVIMKVFGANGGAYMDDIVCALEDAVILGVDVVNASLGSSAGFSVSMNEVIDEVYANLKNTGVIVNFSAGNDGTSSYGNMWGTDMNTTTNPDNAAVGSPSTYANVNSIASVDNAMLLTGAVNVDGVNYMCSEAIGLYVTFNSLAELGEVEYVMVPGVGDVADFEGLDLAGKIAVVARGEINFSSKLANAEAAGAVGLIVTNNEPGSVATFGMSMYSDDGETLPEGVSGNVPAVLVSMATGEVLAAQENKVLTVPAEPLLVLDEGGSQMSAFSSWGVSPDLRLLPDMAGIGGNVYSCYDDGQYGYMSGTSMSSPQVAGMAALGVEYLTEERNITDPIVLREMTNALLMSTADVVVDTDSGVEASPRQQGAGLVDVFEALTSGAYLTVTNDANNNKPKVELGHDPEKKGVYTFSFNVHNFSDEAKTYALGASALFEYPAEVEEGLAFMYGMDYPLSPAVKFSGDANAEGVVTVAAGASAEVTVTITLSDNDKAMMDYYYPNGSYVEGYVYLINADEEGVDLNLPYLGFYGDWTQAPLFDDAFWYENGMWDVVPENGYTDGNQYYTILWTGLAGNDWVIGMNPYSGALVGADGNVIYDPAHNVVSPNGDGLVDGIEEMYISLMRNAKTLVFTYTDEAGNVLFEQGIYNVPKTMYLPAYGQIVPFVYSWYFDNYDFTDAEGNPLPSGTKLNLYVTGTLDYEGEYTTQELVFPLVVDTNAPEVAPEIQVSYDENGTYLTLTAYDESALAAAFVMNPSGTQTLGGAYDNEFTVNRDGSYTITLDITGCGTELVVAVCDFGGNEAYYDVTFSGDELPNGNKPEMDEDALYAYRVYDAAIDDDSLFGWVTIDKQTAEVTQLTNDMYEYYALTAAEYVDGYIFAVDAGNKFIVMEPGLFFRNEIVNLGVSVLDMTFNKADDTMYVTTKGWDEYGYELYSLATLDLMTGELTTLVTSDSPYDLPYAMAATDDGVIYAVKYYDSGLYTVDLENLVLQNVLDADGNAIELYQSTGDVAYPYYSQSMTYDSDDGVIYWSFFTYTSDAELFTIVPATETAAASFSSVEFPVDAELVGVLTLDEDDYQLPAAEKLEKLLLSQEQMILTTGEMAELTVVPLPWNYTPSGAVTWSSDDESVVRVDANGVVTAVAEGTAVITAQCEGVTAECYVKVVGVSGTVYAYDYFNGNEDYGNYIAIDLETVTREPLFESPVDFVAADYNGHNGNIYGYDANGQFYCLNTNTGECVALGAPVSSVPWDMAYDYATGYLYALTVDQNAWTSTIWYVNMNTGALVEYATAYEVFLTLACDTENSLLFAVSYDGILYNLQVVPAEGGGVMPLSANEASVEMMVDMMPIMEGFGDLQYMQSMCWDHNNGVILWTQPEASTIYWIDVYEGYVLDLGDPSGSGQIEYVGMFTIPEVINELPYVAVESITADDMLILEGGSKMAAVSISPLNATNQNVVYVSADETVAVVDASGMITGISEGSTTITGTLTEGDKTFTVSFKVTVKPSAGAIYGYIASDLASGSGQVWAAFSDADPTVDIAYLAGTPYMIYAQEYLNGKLYAYGYDAEDWEANFQFMVIDTETFEIESMTDMGAGFPFVYDMTFDYTTGTMYAVAGYNDNSSDLYMIDLVSGQLFECMSTEPFFTGLAAAADGKLYAMAASEYYYDEMTGMEGYTNAVLYTVDVANGTYEVAFDTGVQCNMLASMAIDFDTGNLYWAQMYRASYWDPVVSGLYLIDLEAEEAYNMGVIGSAGSQVTGMFILADEYPEVPAELLDVALSASLVELGAGQTFAVNVLAQPFNANVKYAWSVADKTVATVDASGVITAVDSGVTTVTVTATDGKNTASATCKVIVYGENDYFLSYNRTEGTFAAISRGDTTKVKLFKSEGDAVRSMEMVNGIVYGFDVNNKFFSAAMADGFVRNYLGEGIVEIPEDTADYKYSYEIRDLAWDASNGRMLALVCTSAYEAAYDSSYELIDGCEIYEVNMANGELTHVCTVAMADASVSNVYTLTVADDGTVYVYSSYDDYVSTLDLQTGYITQLTTLQNQGVYGDAEGNSMAMTYDAVTGNVYMLFTSNGSYYQMVSFNPVSKQLNILGDVGNVVMDEETYEYDADRFSGLIANIHNVNPFKDVKAGAYYFDAVMWAVSNGITAGTSETTFSPDLACTRAQVISFLWRAAGSPEPESAKNPFVDVKKTDYFYEAVLWAYENGITAGVTSNRFAPNAACTRAQIAALLWRAEGKPTPETKVNPFSDVEKGEWYYEAVLWAAENGITAGTGEGKFSPNACCTRAQTVTFLYRAYR